MHIKGVPAVKKSLLMMCPLLLSCLAAGSASAEPCDYIVTDNNLQQVAFFDKTPIALCFTTAVDRFVTGSYKGWAVSLEKGNGPKEAPKEYIEPDPVTEMPAQQENTATKAPPAESTAGADEPAEGHAAESSTPPPVADKPETATADKQSTAEVETSEPATMATVEEHVVAKETTQTAEPPPPVEEITETSVQPDEHAPQAAPTGDTLSEAVPSQKGVAALPDPDNDPVAPHSSWVEVEQQATPVPAQSPTENNTVHPTPAAKTAETHPQLEKPVAAGHTEEHAPSQASASTDSTPDGVAPLQKGAVALQQHTEKPAVPSSRWVEVEQHVSPEPVEAHPEVKTEQPAPAEKAVETTEAPPQVEEQTKQPDPPTVPESAGQPEKQEEEQEEQEEQKTTTTEQPATPEKETGDAELEEPVTVVQFPFVDRLLVAPIGKQSRDTLLFAYVDGKTVPIIIQLKNNLE